jgi:hypothetical protein
MVSEMLEWICRSLDKDFIIFFDEADCLTGPAALTFLSQIRSGYIARNSKIKISFPRSIALVGMRNIKDYKIKIQPEEQSSGAASPFNIITETYTLSNFTAEEIRILYGQHTQASGQKFLDSFIERVWYWSEGQPWLVNALAREAVTNIFNNDYSASLTGEIADQAAENLIKRRDTHVDSLLVRLKEPRIARIMDAVFAGTSGSFSDADEDRRFCIELGLVTEDENGLLRPANAIYREVMSRVLTDQIQGAYGSLVPKMTWNDGKTIFMSSIINEFQIFWSKYYNTFPLRINVNKKLFYDAVDDHIKSLKVDTLVDNNDLRSFLSKIQDIIVRKYDESAYSLFLTSYLQRVVNGGAKVTRQFAQGRGFVDICVEFQKRQYNIEVKLFGKKKLEASLSQLAGYLNTSGEKEGWLVIFDQNGDKLAKERFYFEEINYNGFHINIFGC